MKKKLIMFSVVALGLVGGLTVSQRANAVVAADLLVVGCQSVDGGGHIVALGNSCSKGSASCTSNPCP